jgi:2-polyprenyl-3-methyl-5-hydroxy-6-metoxy-1,4-benzoquinol methylase
MKKNFEVNPNTMEYWNETYKAKRFERLNEWVDPILNPYMKNVKTVLEVGCGMGAFINKMAKTYKGVTFFGTDYSSESIRRAQKHQMKGRRFDMWDVHTPFPFGPKTKFDMVMCLQSMEHMDDPELATKNMASVCNKGGILFITVPTPGSPLDVNKNNLHTWTIYPDDYKKWIIGNVTVVYEGRNHMVVIGEM